RRRTLFFIADTGHRVLRRVVPRWTPGRVRLWRFQHNLNQGLEFLLARKDRMLAPAGWILLDWVLTIAILWAAFRAVNYPIAPGRRDLTRPSPRRYEPAHDRCGGCAHAGLRRAGGALADRRRRLARRARRRGAAHARRRPRRAPPSARVAHHRRAARADRLAL